MNDLVTLYRKSLADQGLDDPRDDYLITQQLGDLAQSKNPSLFDQFPAFAEEWAQIRNANAPSLPSELGRAARAGVKGLGSTALGGLSLITPRALGGDYLNQKARSLEESAAEDAPTIGTLEDIAPGRSTAGKVFSRDALRYGLSKVGGAAPSIAEAITLAGIGAVAGSAVEPGVGTLAGAGAGLIEGTLGRGIIKSSIKSLVAKRALAKEGAESIAEMMARKGLIKEASEEGIEAAIRNGSQAVADVVSQQARQMSARRAGIAANTLNSYLLSSGEIYNETGDRGIAAGLGVLSAIPDTILPAVVVSRLFPNLSSKLAKEEAKVLIGSTVAKVGKKLGLAGAATAGEGATEWFQEGVNIAARNLNDGVDVFAFTDADFKRMREAGIAGAAGGLIASPGLLMERTQEANIAAPKTDQLGGATDMIPPPGGAGAIQRPPSTAELNAPASPPLAEAVGYLRALTRMTDEQKQQRLLDLTNLASRTPQQEAEYNVLRATVKPPTGAEVMAAPAQPTPEPQIRFSVQRADLAPDGRTTPPFVQVDQIDNDPRGVPMTDAERAEYLKLLPDSIPTGVYTLQQVRDFIAAAPTKLVENVAVVPEPPLPHEADRADFQQFIAEKGLTPEAMKLAEANMPTPRPSPEVALGESPIEGRGIFTKKAVGAGEVIAPAKVGDEWTQAGRSANHSPNPNAEMRATENGAELVAIRSMQPNEEVTVNYRQTEGIANTPSLAAPPTAAPTTNLVSNTNVLVGAPNSNPIPVSPALELQTAPEPKLAPAPAITEPVQPFKPGAVIEGSPSIDFRADERFKQLTPEQWRDALRANMAMGVRSGGTGNRAETRIAVALEAPDGRIIKVGLVMPQKALTSTGESAGAEPAFQRMGVTRQGKRIVEVGGNQPASVVDVVAAGYRPRAVIHFAGEPTKIFQTYPNAKAFDAAWNSTPKSSTVNTNVGRPNTAKTGEQLLQDKIDGLGDELLRAKDAVEQNEIIAEIKTLQAQLDRVVTQRQDIASKGQVPRFQTEVRNPDYSRINRAVETSQLNKASGAQWKATIKNSKAGVSMDEWALVGVGDLEDGKTYTKQEVLDYLRANEVVVKEVTLGGKTEARQLPDGRWGLFSGDQFVGKVTYGTEQVAREASEIKNERGSGTHFSFYQLPGAESGSYREVLLTVPVDESEPRSKWEVIYGKNRRATFDTYAEAKREAGDDYLLNPLTPAAHWRDGHSQYGDAKNPIVRLRLNERTTADGKRILFLEEVQAPQKSEFAKMPALFQKNWREIAFKWALRHAAENRFDSIGWTTGEQQAERYDLSKHMSSVSITRNGDDFYSISAWGKDGENVLKKGAASLAEIEANVGKELASKAEKQTYNESVKYEGLDLKVGGEGLKKLYDSDFRNVVNGLPVVKKSGQKVGTAQIQSGENRSFGGEFTPVPLLATVHSIAITDQMREAVMQGQPRFQAAPREPRAASPSRTAEFQAVLGNLRNLGAKVDVFAREFMAQGIRTNLEPMIAQTEQAIAQAQTAAQKNELTRRLDILNERLAAVDQAAGVTYAPYHIAVSVADIQQQSLDNLVTLLHEAVHAMTARLTTAQRGEVLRAVDKTLDTLASRGQQAAEKTGAKYAKTGDAEEVFAESLAQQLAAGGVPDAPSLAQTIVRWVKDLYYRAAMAVQRAFGAEPDAETALAWFKNQLRREVFGDYDYSMASIINRFLPEPLVAKTAKFTGHDGTPSNLTDFRDPISGKMTNPTVSPTTTDAVAWNIAFQTDSPGEGLAIDAPEANARQTAAAINEGLRYATELHKQAGQDMTFEQFLRQTWPGTDPRALLADLEAQFPGAGTATIGGERMTDVMNKRASLMVRSIVTHAERTAIRNQAKLAQEIETHSAALSEAAKEMNRVEADMRNAALHGDILQEKAKEMTRQLIRAYGRGLDTAHTHGELAEAIRVAEDLNEADEIPAQYQQVLKRISDGEIPVFDYIKAIARLDLPISDMTVKEILRAIEGNSDTNETLKQLWSNRPLAVALTALAKGNTEQVDQIQLGWLRDATEFRKIHEQLEEIRKATPQQLKQLISTMNEKAGAKSLEDRIKKDYLEKRRDLQRANSRLQSADERLSLFERVRAPLHTMVEEAQRKGGGSFSDWQVRDGAEFTAMRLQDDGTFNPVRRTLKFKPDGQAVDSDQVQSDVAQNRLWLETNTDKAGQKDYEQIKRETLQLANHDVQRKYPAGWQAYGLRTIDKLVRTPISAIKELGGAASARLIQKLNRFQFIQRTYATQLEGPTAWWSKSQADVMKAAGMKDVGVFLNQVYNPVSYFLNSNPGLDEAAAVRKATALARKLIPGEPAADFNEQFGVFLRRTKELSETVAGIAEQYGVFIRDPRIKGELRRALPTGWLTSMRSLNGGLVQTMTDMETAGWKMGYRDAKDANGKLIRVPAQAVTFDSIDPTNAKNKAERKSYMDGLANTDGLRGILGPLFTPQIIQRWLEPFINKPGVEPFSYNNRPIPQLDAQAAWAAANGDVLAWIDGLSKTVKLGTDKEGGDPLALFRLSMLRQLDSLFGMEAKLAAKAKQDTDLFDPMGPRPNALMEARLNELIPPEHLKFQSFDAQAVHGLLGQLAFTGAFGRNGEALIADFKELRNTLQGAKAKLDQLDGTTRGAKAAQAAALGFDFKEMEKAAKRYDDAVEVQKQLQAVFGVGNPAGPFHDMRATMSVLSGMAGQIVDNPKTGAYNLLSVAMRPFAMKSLGPMSISDSAKGYAGILQTGAGSMLEAMGLRLMHASEYQKDVAESEGQVFRELPYGVVLADQGDRGRFQTTNTDKWVIRPLRWLRALQKKGVKIGVPTENNEFPRMAPIPGLGVLNYISQLYAQGSVPNLVQRLEKTLVYAIRHFEANPQDAANPSFRFTAKQLKFGRLDTGVFDWLRNKTVEYGLGNLEDMAREAGPRMARAERLITKDQVQRVAMIAANELDGAASINTTPLMMQTNPVLKALMPLLRWPLWMMSAAHQGLQNAEGRATFKSVAKGLGTLALWNLPMGLAFSFLMEEYDEKILNKKSNSRGIDKIAGVPIIGPAMALMFGDKTVGQNMLGFAERMGKAGNVYGAGADMLNQFVAPFDPNSGQRQFSLDQRVLAMSQFLNFQQAFRNLAATGGADTWSSFWKPFLQSIGGNGALHALDISNNLLGLDNAESRLVMRINAQNWLRSAGRELDFPLQTGGGATSPSPLSVWSREMQLAAMANDRMGFMENYQKAMNAAREAVANDPHVDATDRENEAKKRVLASWRARDPRAVFAHKLTDAQYRQVLSVMSDDGKQDVTEAVRRYESFTQTIKPTQFESRQQTQIRRSMNPTQARQQLSLSPR